MLQAQSEPVEHSEADIAIIGCGPVGAMLANLLGIQGISTVVLEREADVYALPRACHFDDEVMRLFQTVGLADEMVPLVHVSPGMRFVDGAGTLLLDWTRPTEIGPQGWNVRGTGDRRRAEITADAIRIGVLSDMSGIFATAMRPGSVTAAQMAPRSPLPQRWCGSP